MKSEDKETLRAAAKILESYPEYTSRLQFTGDTAACEFFSYRLSGEEREHFEVAFLDTQNRLITTERLFSGTLDGANVYPREVARAALLHNASAVILAHNHPSGSTEASHDDRNITTRVRDALNLLEVRTLDHIIVGYGGETLSFASKGYL